MSIGIIIVIIIVLVVMAGTGVYVKKKMAEDPAADPKDMSPYPISPVVLPPDIPVVIAPDHNDELIPVSSLPPPPEVVLPPGVPSYDALMPVWKIREERGGKYKLYARDPITNNVMCNTVDGKNCKLYSTHGDAVSAAAKGPFNPLICGDMHKKVWGVASTDDPNHWCFSGRTDI